MKLLDVEARLVIYRTGEDNNRNALQFCAGSKFGQYVLTFLLGQLHVQQDQVRRRGLGEFAFTVEKADRLSGYIYTLRLSC